MATRHSCDGCGTEVHTAGELKALTVTYGPGQVNPVTFDLCSRCKDDFIRLHLPNKWPRGTVAQS